MTHTIEALFEAHKQLATRVGDYASVQYTVRGKADEPCVEIRVWSSQGGWHSGDNLAEAVQAHNDGIDGLEPAKLLAEARHKREEADELEALANKLKAERQTK